MRIYSEPDQENLRTLSLLTDWTGEGLLSESQHLTMKQDVECGLRRTNFFLRFVFFLFTFISVSAAIGLFFASNPNNWQIRGVILLVAGALCYWGAEAAVAWKRFYRHGVEEALAVLSILFLCFGLELTFFSRIRSSGQKLVRSCLRRVRLVSDLAPLRISIRLSRQR